MNEIQKNIRKGSAIRTWFQAAWFVLTNGYIRGYTKGMIFTGNTKVLCLPGLNCYSCPGALASCPMGSLQAVMGNSTYRISLYVFGFMAAIGVLFGRLVCGWMCPFGLFQDLIYKIPIKLKKKNLPGHRYLKYLRYVILVIFPILLVSIITDLTGTSGPWFCEWICPSGMLLGGIPLVTMNAGLRAAAGFQFAWKLSILVLILVLSVVYYRPFCKYLCPLGAIYGFFNPIAGYRLVIDRAQCVSCGSCQRACGMDIRTFENPNSFDCIRCGNCMAACPKGAITSTWKQAGEKIRSRCFIDEDTGMVLADPERDNAVSVGAPAAESLPGPSAGSSKKPLFFGIIMILLGAEALSSTIFFGLYNGFVNRFTIDIIGNSPLDIIGCLILSLASAMLMLTGFFAVRYWRDNSKLPSLVEKTKVVFIAMIAGFLISALSIFLVRGAASTIISTFMYSVSILIGAPSALLQALVLHGDTDHGSAAEERRGLKRAGRKVVWIVLSIVDILILVLPIILLFSMILAQQG